MIGELIGHYRIVELVGRGAMGVVYKALDENLDRPVAIKVMSVEARNYPDFVERFRQEARLQGALNHPNIALLFDYFIHEGAPVAVMEFIDGESLEQLIRRRGPIPGHETIRIFKQALQGVAAAHRAGIIHRDLKPSNLMITKDDIVKVMDFGIAKRQGTVGATKASTSIGSPLYMAPEQILGRAVDCRTDVYALGTTLYQCLSGQPPFDPRGKAEYVVLSAHVNDLPQPPTVHCRDIAQPIVDVVMRALAKEPDARFQSADEFMRALADVPAPHEAALRVDSSDTIVLDYGAATLRLEATLPQASYPPQSVASPSATAAHVVPAGTRLAATPSPIPAPSSPAASTAAPGVPWPALGLKQRPRGDRPVATVVLVALLVLGTLVHHAKRRHAPLRSPSLASSIPRFTQASVLAAKQTPLSTEPAAAPLAALSSAADPAVVPSTDLAAATAVPAVPPTAAMPATTTVPTWQDLLGTWRGEYVDASGKQLLRVVSLSINRVHGDGGIDGTLQYETASGEGECQLHPRGSSYSAGEQRLQLSPEGCSPHYPKELGVPLDFDGVNPEASTLKDGRIEAPSGGLIRVKLKRVSGV